MHTGDHSTCVIESCLRISDYTEMNSILIFDYHLQENKCPMPTERS